jgi:hypothetical protein
MSRIGLGVCLVSLLVCPPPTSYAGSNLDAKLALHLVASAEYFDCPELAPAACESIDVDLSIEEILAAGGYGYVVLVAYDIESITGLEFAVAGWPSGRGAPPLTGPTWCTDRLTLGNHTGGGGITSFEQCMEPESSGVAALAYWTFGPLDSTDLPIDLSILPSTFTDEDSLLYVMDCTVDHVQDDVVAVSGCAIGGGVRVRAGTRV